MYARNRRIGDRLKKKRRRKEGQLIYRGFAQTGLASIQAYVIVGRFLERKEKEGRRN